MAQMKVDGISFPYPGGEKLERGKVIGTWGSPENPVVMHVVVGGVARAATKAERIAVRRLGQFDWVPAFEAKLHATGHGPHPLADYPLPPGQSDAPSPVPEEYLSPDTSPKPNFNDWLTWSAIGAAKACPPSRPLLKRAIYDLRAAMGKAWRHENYSVHVVAAIRLFSRGKSGLAGAILWLCSTAILNRWRLRSWPRRRCPGLPRRALRPRSAPTAPPTSRPVSSNAP